MIRIDFAEPLNDANWKPWREQCAKETQNLIGEYQARRSFKIKAFLYRARKPLFTDARGAFHGKCAYCEKTITNQYGEIEHYRPKSGVLHENRSPVYLESEGAVIPHPGYYWLAYDWHNLLPSCTICNGPAWKGNRFPVEGVHLVLQERNVSRSRRFSIHAETSRRSTFPWTQPVY